MRGALLVCCVVCSAAASPTAMDTAAEMTRTVVRWFTPYEEAPYTQELVPGTEIEKRTYPGRNWVCTKTTVSPEEDGGQRSMFWRLFNYIQGANQGQVKMEMTVPVSTFIQTGSNEEQMCFYLGQEYQASPPSPTEAEVFITNRQATLYTRRVPGYMSTALWQQEAVDLAAELNKLQIQFSSDRYYKVGYDAPFKFWNRRNEVWYTQL